MMENEQNNEFKSDQGNTKSPAAAPFCRRSGKPDQKNVTLAVFFLLLILFLAGCMILPRWIPRENPEGIYNARLWLMNCMCGEGRAYLVVTKDRTWHAVGTHPGDESIKIAGTWEKDQSGGILFVTRNDGKDDKFVYRAGVFQGVLKLMTESGKTEFIWMPRLLSGFSCDYYNTAWWLNAAFAVCLIMVAASAVFALPGIFIRLKRK